MKVLLYLLLLMPLIGYSQDYSRKPYASIHHYAERMLGTKIVDRKEDVDLRKGTLYYYKERDLIGNYVHVSGGYMGDYFFAYWKMSNGNDLIGVTHYNCQANCLYECSFYEFSEDDSVEVSSQVMPLKKMVKHMKKMKAKVIGSRGNMDDEEVQFKFVLPHNSGVLGVHISMDRNKIEFPILELQWTGERFEVKAKYKEVPEL